MDAAFGVLALTPPPVQRALAHAFAHPRLSNLTISSVAGPAVPRYLHGCRLREVHSAVPLSARHALSIGVVTVAGRVCFGLFADAHDAPGRGRAGADVGAAFDELAAAARAGSRRRRGQPRLALRPAEHGVAQPATTASTSREVEWKWWKSNTPSTHEPPQPLAANRSRAASGPCSPVPR